jgi:Arc/MetJ-type ribon-helix-helix transcriptional regulator
MRHQRTIGFSETLAKEIDRVSRERDFASATAFIRYAVQQELSGRQDGLTGAEERLAASIEQVRKDLYRLMRVQQALFAYVDTLAKTILTCMPEPPADAKPQAVARAKERYDRLLKSAGRAMVGDAKIVMQDLVINGER